MASATSTEELFGSPMVSSLAFHPRTATKNESKAHNAIDGEVHVPHEKDPISGEPIRLGFRLYPHPEQPQKAPLVLYFHGNAEICTDYDGLHSYFHTRVGASLMVMDYRGYGWSSGTPNLMTLQKDARFVMTQLDQKLEQASIGKVPIVLYGRSIGSVCAIHLARLSQTVHSGERSLESAEDTLVASLRRVQALILESAICNLLELPMVQQLASMMPSFMPLLENGAVNDPWDNKGQIRRVHLPCAIIHGDADEISPVQQGIQLYESAGTSSEQKRKIIFSGAGHNDLISSSHRFDQYFDALKDVIEQSVSQNGEHIGVESGASKTPRKRSDETEGASQNRVEPSETQTEQCGCNIS